MRASRSGSALPRAGQSSRFAGSPCRGSLGALGERMPGRRRGWTTTSPSRPTRKVVGRRVAVQGAGADAAGQLGERDVLAGAVGAVLQDLGLGSGDDEQARALVAGQAGGERDRRLRQLLVRRPAAGRPRWSAHAPGQVAADVGQPDELRLPRRLVDLAEQRGQPDGRLVDAAAGADLAGHRLREAVLQQGAVARGRPTASPGPARTAAPGSARSVGAALAHRGAGLRRRRRLQQRDRRGDRGDGQGRAGDGGGHAVAAHAAGAALDAEQRVGAGGDGAARALQGRAQLVVDGAHAGTPVGRAVRGSSRRPEVSRSLASAREVVDFTVPTETPRTRAVSASERSS